MKLISGAQTDHCRRLNEWGSATPCRGLTQAAMTLVLAAVFPVASPALADDAQPQSTPDQAQAPARSPAPAAALGPSITGPLHYNSNPLHVDGGPLGPV